MIKRGFVVISVTMIGRIAVIITTGTTEGVTAVEGTNPRTVTLAGADDHTAALSHEAAADRPPTKVDTDREVPENHARLPLPQEETNAETILAVPADQEVDVRYIYFFFEMLVNPFNS
eukprot:GHVO01027322.1.p1 GENE.GHVO01027322.1~~GHVO01027322.1.p1  ORF type:complete len:118 (+),score=11.06 GHVO01027322.1:326-679(+)